MQASGARPCVRWPWQKPVTRLRAGRTVRLPAAALPAWMPRCHRHWLRALPPDPACLSKSGAAGSRALGIHIAVRLTWGSAGGKPRYRCAGCRKTFNPLTGTPLSGLHDPERRRNGQRIECLAASRGVPASRPTCSALPATRSPAHRSSTSTMSMPITAASRNGCAAAMAQQPKTCPTTAVGVERSRRWQTLRPLKQGSWAPLAGDPINRVQHKNERLPLAAAPPHGDGAADSGSSFRNGLDNCDRLMRTPARARSASPRSRDPASATRAPTLAKTGD